MKSTVSKGEFKAKALEFFREVERTGVPIVVTDHGRPVVEIRAYRSQEPSPLALLRESVARYDAPCEPIGEDDWEASNL